MPAAVGTTEWVTDFAGLILLPAAAVGPRSGTLALRVGAILPRQWEHGVVTGFAVVCYCNELIDSPSCPFQVVDHYIAILDVIDGLVAQCFRWNWGTRLLMRWPFWKGAS